MHAGSRLPFHDDPRSEVALPEGPRGRGAGEPSADDDHARLLRQRVHAVKGEHCFPQLCLYFLPPLEPWLLSICVSVRIEMHRFSVIVVNLARRPSTWAL